MIEGDHERRCEEAAFLWRSVRSTAQYSILAVSVGMFGLRLVHVGYAYMNTYSHTPSTTHSIYTARKPPPALPFLLSLFCSLSLC